MVENTFTTEFSITADFASPGAGVAAVAFGLAGESASAARVVSCETEKLTAKIAESKVRLRKRIGIDFKTFAQFDRDFSSGLRARRNTSGR